MRLEHEQSFSAQSAVGRYWLLNSVGFRVQGMYGRGVVEEVGLGHDGVDVLAVRRGGALGRRLVLVPVERVESVHPWEDTLVVSSRRQRARASRAEQAHVVRRRVGQDAKTGAAVGAQVLRACVVALRDGAVVLARLLALAGALLTRATQRHAPHARRAIANAGATAVLILRAYGTELRRALHEQRDAVAAWREASRQSVEEPGDDGPLTRAGADDVDAPRKEAARR
jgi:hypothetical protein